jgi:cytochrome c oxidase subunit 4
MSAKIISLKTYTAVFVALLVLLALTIIAAFIPWGGLHGLMAPLVAMTIAFVKMVLILLYFMHVRYSSKLTWIFVVSMFAWLAILILFTIVDFITRDVTPIPQPW